VKIGAGFLVITAAVMKMAAFWVVALCSLVEVYRSVRVACCLHHQGLKKSKFVIYCPLSSSVKSQETNSGSVSALLFMKVIIRLIGL
jgi:hypothetical protein